jgi:hypothetical protein
MIHYSFNFSEIARRLKNTVVAMDSDSLDFGWVDQLLGDSSALRNALDAEGENIREILEPVIWRVNRVLTKYPIEINLLLCQSVRELKLNRLCREIILMYPQLSKEEVDEHAENAVNAGLVALGSLDEALKSLTEVHDRWQHIDLDLRAINADSSSGMRLLRAPWLGLSGEIEKLLCGVNETWATEMRNKCQLLSKLVIAEDYKEFKRCFRPFRRACASRFFEIDASLLSLCGNLRRLNATSWS